MLALREGAGRAPTEKKPAKNNSVDTSGKAAETLARAMRAASPHKNSTPITKKSARKILKLPGVKNTAPERGQGG